MSRMIWSTNCRDSWVKSTLLVSITLRRCSWVAPSITTPRMMVRLTTTTISSTSENPLCLVRQSLRLVIFPRSLPAHAAQRHRICEHLAAQAVCPGVLPRLHRHQARIRVGAHDVPAHIEDRLLAVGAAVHILHGISRRNRREGLARIDAAVQGARACR